ncbi:MAG: hypothetical protein GY870_14995 [archaeon]|nr:hypothetical protein [archaeon]
MENKKEITIDVYDLFINLPESEREKIKNDCINKFFKEFLKKNKVDFRSCNYEKIHKQVIDLIN